MTYVLDRQARQAVMIEREKSVSVTSVFAALGLPQPSVWNAGGAVSDFAAGELKPGTLIAAFGSGSFHPGGLDGSEVAIYLGHDAGGIEVLAPRGAAGAWKATRLSLYAPCGGRSVNDGHLYHVVER